MAPRDSNAVKTALGNICIISEKSTTYTSRKLGSVELRSDEFLYLLATFCFDFSRRMDYLFKATREFAPEAMQKLASEVLDDHEAINASGLTWKQRAERAEAIMLRLAGEVGEEHAKALKKAARRK